MIQKISLGYIGAVLSAAFTALICIRTTWSMVFPLFLIILLSAFLAALAGLFIGHFSDGLCRALSVSKVVMILFLAPPGAVLSDHFKRQYSSHRNISAPVQCRILRDPGPDNRRWQTDRGIYLCTFAALHALDGRIPSHIPPQKLPRRAGSMTGLRAPTAAGMLSRPPPFSCGYPSVIYPRSPGYIHSSNGERRPAFLQQILKKVRCRQSAEL